MAERTITLTAEELELCVEALRFEIQERGYFWERSMVDAQEALAAKLEATPTQHQRRYEPEDVRIGDIVMVDSALWGRPVTGVATSVVAGGVCLDGDLYVAWDRIVGVKRASAGEGGEHGE